VTGATLGIVGLGRIGRAVARRARGFEMRLLYTQDRRMPDAEAALGIAHRSLDELLAESDIVSLHCPLTDRTRGLLSRDRIARMKRGAILVNTARGPCVAEAALADAIARGHLAAAGLDVFEAEPRIHPALVDEPRVVLATHIASADLPTRAAMAGLCADAVLAVLAGAEPRCRVV
jgi:glyoxylate reductase